MPAVIRIVIIGPLLIIGGFFGVLPILGFWMIPLGLVVMFLDFRWARRTYISIFIWLRQRATRGKRDKNE